MSSPAPGSPPAASAAARRSSSTSTRSSIEVSSTIGTASTSPGTTSATRTAALTRHASNAKKRISVGGAGPAVKAGAGAGGALSSSSSSSSSTAPGLRRSTSSSHRNDSTVISSRMSASASNEGSLSSIVDGDDAAASTSELAETPEELSRLTRDQLVALVVRERRSKEEVEVRLSDISTELATTAQKAADAVKVSQAQDSKIQEAYATSERLERELAEHIESLTKAETTAHNAEKEGREAQRRLREEVERFEADRATWLEGEQSLQTQIAKIRSDCQALQVQQQEQHMRVPSSDAERAGARSPADGSQWLSQPVQSPVPSHISSASPTFQIPQGTLEELQSLHTRVAELTADQQSTLTEVQRLESELEELSRLNGDLQEQNENYEVLLSERMLAGLANFVDSGIGSSGNASSMQDSSLSDGGIGSRPSSSFGALAEHPSEGDASDAEQEEPEYFESSGDGRLATGAVPVQVTPNRIGRTAKKRQSMMGVGGGGFDLEAELDRAQREEEEQRVKLEEQNKKKARAAASARRRANQTSANVGHDGDAMPDDVDGLRKEVKLLRQENKGLSTYVSKILERIIGIDGFEKVLSVEREPKPTPEANVFGVTTPPPVPPAKPSAATLGVAPPHVRPPPLRATSSTTSSVSAGPVSPIAANPGAAELSTKKKNRFSMDWIASSIFKSGSTDSQTAAGTAAASASATAPGLKPMMLTGGPALKQPVVEEDEDDRRARARLQSEMRLLGIDAHTSPAMSGGSPGAVKIGASRSPSKRISSGNPSPVPPSLPPKEVDVAAREKEMQTELDNGRASGFTELPAGSPSDSVKIRGHRKKPSGTYTMPGSNQAGVGLGVTYNRDSEPTPTWGTRTPSLGTGSNPSDPGDNRSSFASQQST